MYLLLPFLTSILGWIFRPIVVKFLILATIFFLLEALFPFLVGLIAPFIAPDALNSAFANIPSGVWWILNLARIDIGAPMVISAYITRFMIRRMPFIG
jgi:hypothetical protein